jgi:hypothetical protein
LPSERVQRQIDQRLDAAEAARLQLMQPSLERALRHKELLKA